MKKRFYKDSYQLGYNSRDDAENIPFESCQSLVNARPGNPNPTPREGIVEWGPDPGMDSTVRFQFPFKTVDENYLIYVTQDAFSDWSLYFHTESGGSVLIAADAISSNTLHYTGVRIKDSLYILTDTGFSYIVTYAAGTFTLRNGNIVRPSIAITPTAAVGVGVAVPAGFFVSFAATLVNRNDLAAFSGADAVLCDLDTVGFAPGLLESIDDIDGRITFENTSGDVADVALSILINNGLPLDPQATHLRLYATDAQVTADLAEGSEHKWFADLPLFGANATGVPQDPGPQDAYEYTFAFDPGQMAGALDVLLVVGYDAIPPAKYGFYIQGRLWLGSADTSGDGVGRWYYSEIPLNLEAPLKWASLFVLATNFKDTSLDNADLGAGIGISRNDLIFVMSASVWSLRDGDPDFEPVCIDPTAGSPFPGTVTPIGRDLAYLGNDGPVVIQGREAVPLDQFTAGEVWPLSRGRPGYFFSLADKTKVQGFYFRESFFLADESKIVGMHMPGSGNGRGPWEIVPASPIVKIGHVSIFDRDTCVISSRTDLAPLFYQLLVEGEYQDLGENILLRSKSMVYLFDARNRDQAGELYDLYVNAGFSDAGRFDVFVSCSYFRHRFETTYDETPSTDILTDDSIDPSWRKVLAMGVPEGLVGFGFEVEWVKEYAAPFDFEISGFILRAKPVDGHPVEFVSRDLGSGPIENGPDIEFWYGFDFNALTEEDRSSNLRNLSYEDVAGAGTRTYDATLPPSGGNILTGAVMASGYRSAAWTGITALGARGLSREYVLRAAALPRTAWLELGGDGTSFFGVKLTPAGALVLAVYTPAVKRTYSTADGVIAVAPAAGTDYTVQITLSADMLTCRFYVALRTGAYTALAVPTMAVLPAGGPGVYEPGGISSVFGDSFAALNGAKWTGGAVAGGRLTASAVYSGSALAIGANDVLTVAANMRLASSGSYGGGSLAKVGMAFVLPSAVQVNFYVAGDSSGVGGPIRIILIVGAGTPQIFILPGAMIPSQDYDFRLTAEISRAALALYVDGVLCHTYKFATAATALSTFTLAMLAHGDVTPSVDTVFFAGIAGLGTAGGTLDLVEIPTRHVLLPGATYGISHARGLRIAKPAARAQAFHNAMKGKTK